MSNVIHLKAPFQRQTRHARLGALLASFAQHRRGPQDVFWLKENAELLNILECTGEELSEDLLAPHEEFYATIERRMSFFPQYYRFLLSICLDLEDLGLPGRKGEQLAHFVAEQGLADAELSDLQRAEARRLTLRRGIDAMPEDLGLEDRLRAFIDRSQTFAMPNKKAAYELTHIVFYLSEYGRCDPALSQAAITSLEYAGILAYLDQNADLLAEICVALRFAGVTPSQIWEDWLERETCLFTVETGPGYTAADNYHDYFVCNWLMASSGRASFTKPASTQRMSFFRTPPEAAPLREMSEMMFRMEDMRSGDWDRMRAPIADGLSGSGSHILMEAERSSDKFAGFFAGFARTALQGVTL